MNEIEDTPEFAQFSSRMSSFMREVFIEALLQHHDEGVNVEWGGNSVTFREGDFFIRFQLPREKFRVYRNNLLENERFCIAKNWEGGQCHFNRGRDGLCSTHRRMLKQGKRVVIPEPVWPNKRNRAIVRQLEAIEREEKAE
ncbi:MAG TPA: hypothetical protein VLV83_14975 [Acidobacteriota bacterium]|nr:hypothetical protein [Acidobacteriota bacterium]